MSALGQKQTFDRYSITLSARARTVEGTVRPIARAVVRLITSSNLLGCSTGIITGLCPMQDFVDHVGSPPEQIGVVRSIGHETTGFDIIAIA
jgi:hypothetical protein